MSCSNDRTRPKERSNKWTLSNDAISFANFPNRYTYNWTIRNIIQYEEKWLSKYHKDIHFIPHHCLPKANLTFKYRNRAAGYRTKQTTHPVGQTNHQQTQPMVTGSTLEFIIDNILFLRDRCRELTLKAYSLHVFVYLLGYQTRIWWFEISWHCIFSACGI